MDYADVNQLLKRPLQDGSSYDRYFKNSSCTPSYLGTSDTAFTVRQMVKWAEKNKGQTKALALEQFSGFVLPVTVKKIYDFLYAHIQYELDDRTQNLKSPACTWATRQSGTDCKSYGIFASTILSNLGVKHYFRRVKQPNPEWPTKGIDPNKWSHVYVIVPKNQKSPRAENPSDYYVLDATTHDNKEVRFVQKSDRLVSKVSLPHYGLQAPASTALGCGFDHGSQLSLTRTNGLGVAGEIQIPQNFGGYGSREDNDMTSSLVSGLTNSLVAGAQAAQQNKLAVSQGTREQRLAAIGQSGATSVTIKSIGAAAAPYTWGISSVLTLVPNEWYEKVLGQWFKDGWDCIGSTWTENKAKQTVEIESEFIKSEAAAVFYKFETGTISEIEAAINKWMEFFYSVRSTERDWLATTAKDCTRDGLILLIKSLDEAKKEIVSKFKTVIASYGHNLVSSGTKTVKYPPETHTGRHALTQKVEQFIIQLNPTLVAQSKQSTATLSRQTLQKFNTNPQQAGFGTTGVLALLALAAGTYLYNS